MNSNDEVDMARFERFSLKKDAKVPSAEKEEDEEEEEENGETKAGTTSLQPWITLANHEINVAGTVAGGTGSVVAAVDEVSSSSSILKLANFNFFSSERVDDEQFFLEHCSPSIYLIENSETVENHDLSSTSNSSCRSLLLDDEDDEYSENSENEDEEYIDEEENEGDQGDVVDTVSHLRKLFEKNVVRVKRSAYFLSLPDLRPVRWLSAQDYFYYSLQDLASLAEFYCQDEQDDDDMLRDERITTTTTTTTTGAACHTNTVTYFDSNCSLKDEEIFVGDQQPDLRSSEDGKAQADDDDDDDEEYEVQESGSEEITWSRDGDNEVRTLIKLKRNEQNHSWEKTTVVTTFFPNGQSHTDTYYETLFDDEEDEDERSSDDGDDDHNMSALDEESVRRRYEKFYQLRGNQYDLLKKCFRKMESEGFISRPLLRVHIQAQVKDRSRLIQADDATIDRTLETIDTDADGNVSFQDFLDYLYLFFASKKNVRTKIVNVLTGHKRKHLSRGRLTEREANQFFDFLAEFYGLKDDERQKASFADIQSYDEFADRIYPILEKKLFVTWL